MSGAVRLAFQNGWRRAPMMQVTVLTQWILPVAAMLFLTAIVLGIL